MSTQQQTEPADRLLGRLRDQVIIVTGASGGIGPVYVDRLAREGAHVVVADMNEQGARSVAERVGGTPGQSLAVTVDVADPASVEAMVSRTLDAFGRVDALVNNAAIFSVLEHHRLEEIPPDEWDRVFAVNVRGTWLCCRAVVPHMRARRRGKIVNIASGTILWGAPNFLHYVTSKGAVFALTRAAARELGPDGICVNTLAPGLIATEATRAMEPEEMFERSRTSRPLARDENPDDLAGTLVYLCSSDSDFVTGQMIVVNGGAQMW